MIAIIGLGYVGLPLYCRLREHFDVVGFDCDQERVFQLQNSIDKNGDIDFAKNINDTKKVIMDVEYDADSPLKASKLKSRPLVYWCGYSPAVNFDSSA